MSISQVPYDTENGAEIDIFISRPASISAPEEVAASRRRVRLLIDTGAKRTAISRKILDEMGLLPIAKTMMKTAGDDIEVGIYHVDLICDYLSPVLRMEDIQVSEFKSKWRDGVLGRDFLENVILEVNHSEGKVRIIT